MRERAAQDRAVQHARQRDVVDERPLPPDEPRVLLARERPVSVVHAPASCFAAHSTDLTMFSYPVHRQTWPEMASRTSAAVGSGWLSSSHRAVIIIPGVQKPHC